MSRKKLSDKELLAIEHRVNAASPGPWYEFFRAKEFEGDGGGFDVSADDEYGTFMLAEVEKIGSPNDKVFCEQTRKNRDFIVHSRVDMVRLIEEIRRLRSVRK